MANVDTISDISNSADGEQNNPILLWAMASAVHSSPPLFFLMYYTLLLLSEFADANRVIPSFILINNNIMMVKSSTTVKATKAPAATKKNKKIEDRTWNYTQTETMGFLQLMEEIKPIGSEEWDLLVRRHAEAFPP